MESAAGRLLTAEELGQRLRVGKATVYRMVRKNLIRAVPVGAELGALRFDEAEVREDLSKLLRTPRTYHPPKGKRAEAVPA